MADLVSINAASDRQLQFATDVRAEALRRISEARARLDARAAEGDAPAFHTTLRSLLDAFEAAVCSETDAQTLIGLRNFGGPIAQRLNSDHARLGFSSAGAVDIALRQQLRVTWLA